nr:unknown protein [Ipomoea trifida]
MSILVVIRIWNSPRRKIVPELPEGEFRLHVVHVDLNGGESLDEIVAFDEIESPTVESDIGFEPVHPLRDFSLHSPTTVVDVGRVLPRVASVGISGASERGIVAANLGGAPVEFIAGSSDFEEVEHSSVVGSLSGYVIQHNIGDAFNSCHEKISSIFGNLRIPDRRPPNLAGSSDDFSTVQPVAVVAVPLWLPQTEAAVTHPSSATFNFTGSAGFAAVWSVAVVAVVTSSSVSLKSLISSLL